MNKEKQRVKINTWRIHLATQLIMFSVLIAEFGYTQSWSICRIIMQLLNAPLRVVECMYLRNSGVLIPHSDSPPCPGPYHSSPVGGQGSSRQKPHHSMIQLPAIIFQANHTMIHLAEGQLHMSSYRPGLHLQTQSLFELPKHQWAQIFGTEFNKGANISWMHYTYGLILPSRESSKVKWTVF